jgi:hypothetical protein
MVHLATQILCITNNYAYKEQFRNILALNSNISILFIHNISEAISQLQSHHFILVIIDEVLSIEDTHMFKQLLTLITSLCINLHTLIIVPKISNDYFAQYIPLGFTYITDMSVAKHMLPAVLKNIGEFKSQRPPPQKVIYKGLILNPESNTIILKSCRIHIMPTETLILLFLIKHRGYSNTCVIQKYLCSVFEKSISQSYISVNIHRLSKRIKNATGLEIIKNRYGVGYYLVL